MEEFAMPRRGGIIHSNRWQAIAAISVFRRRAPHSCVQEARFSAIFQASAGRGEAATNGRYRPAGNRCGAETHLSQRALSSKLLILIKPSPRAMTTP
jgi:hypothetical protein